MANRSAFKFGGGVVSGCPLYLKAFFLLYVKLGKRVCNPVRREHSVHFRPPCLPSNHFLPFVHHEREHFEAPQSTTQLYFVSFSFISCLKIKILFLRKTFFLS